MSKKEDTIKTSEAETAAEAPAADPEPEPAQDEAAPAKENPKKTEDAEGQQGEDASAKPETEAEEGAINEPGEFDVLSGRGASVNANRGNQVFRALCFKRKPEFDAGSHAAKRRIATEIVSQTKSQNGRFLKRRADKGPWYEVSNEKAILKACQVMRDYKRPDRVALRAMAAANGNARKRQRSAESTPMDPASETPVTPLEPILENPFGVHDHDVLAGRGAFINGHVGNERFRKLCQERKTAFDAGSYTEKRALATEVFTIIRGLDPPGRFLKRSTRAVEELKIDYDTWTMPPRGLDGTWEELSDDAATHKACQVMRDIARPDRAGEKRIGFKDGKGSKKKGKVDPKHSAAAQAKDSMTMLAETTAEASAVEEAVAATEEALDKALDCVPKPKEDAVAAETAEV